MKIRTKQIQITQSFIQLNTRLTFINYYSSIKVYNLYIYMRYDFYLSNKTGDTTPLLRMMVGVPQSLLGYIGLKRLWDPPKGPSSSNILLKLPLVPHYPPAPALVPHPPALPQSAHHLPRPLLLHSLFCLLYHLIKIKTLLNFKVSNINI